MKVLVIGGTGMVGSLVVRELLARGAQVSVLTRDQAKIAMLPAGAAGVVGNLLSPSTVRGIFTGVDGVFLLNVVSPTESHEALLALCGMRLAGVKRLVYLSVQHAAKAAYLPHFGAKAGVEEAIRRAGIPFTVLQPNNFHQNDYWYKDVLLQYGLYPQPIGNKGCSRVDVRDIAEAAAIALTASGREHEGQVYELVGPEPVTGNSTAATWSRVLNKPIAYAGDDLDAWEKQALAYMPDWAAFDFRTMYGYFQQEGFVASAEAIARHTALLGHPPRSFDAFAAETAKVWLGV
jgi:uncharacterized protein YbjT (DUF2867 family)